MAIVNLKYLGHGYVIRKKFVKSTIDNPLLPNDGPNAFPDLQTGIYKAWRRYGVLTNWRCVLYTPTNHQTVPQQAHRAIYGAGVEAWRDLTSEQKQTYNVSAYGKHMSGYNLFMKNYLLTH